MADQVLFIDSSHSIASVQARGHNSFFDNRHYNHFRLVWSAHPLVGLLDGRRAGAIRVERFSSRQVILDGVEPGPLLPHWRQPLNVLLAQARMIAALVRIARRPAVSAVIATDPFYSGLLGLIASKLSGKPLMVASYANQDELYEATGALTYPRLLRFRRLELAIQHLVLRNADLVESPTANMRDYLVRHKARPDRIVTIPVVGYVSAIHQEAPEQRASPQSVIAARGWPEARRILLTISRLHALKFVDDSITAMTVIAKERPDVIGIVAGEGPMRAQLEAQIEAAGMQGRIFLPGEVSQEELSALIPGSIVLSPLSGMALIEASLAGAPPIVYDRDWQPEFVTDNVNGFVVPPRDVDAMIDRARELLEDEGLYRRLSISARERAIEFSDPGRHRVRQRDAAEQLVAIRTRRS